MEYAFSGEHAPHTRPRRRRRKRRTLFRRLETDEIVDAARLLATPLPRLPIRPPEADHPVADRRLHLPEEQLRQHLCARRQLRNVTSGRSLHDESLPAKPGWRRCSACRLLYLRFTGRIGPSRVAEDEGPGRE